MAKLFDEVLSEKSSGDVVVQFRQGGSPIRFHSLVLKMHESFAHSLNLSEPDADGLRHTILDEDPETFTDILRYLSKKDLALS